MDDHRAHFEANRALWNARTELHYASQFYDVEAFVNGKSTLNRIELDLLGDVNRQDLLHLQCHFGQDTLSLARLGAHVTGLDLSDQAVAKARELSDRCGIRAEFIEGNVLDRRTELEGRFDVVFTTYGTIGWLPELSAWAANIAAYLKPGGRLVFAEFHPALWMYSNDFSRVQYSYFNREVIEENESGTYAVRNAPLQLPSFAWNHSLADVVQALIIAGLRLDVFREYDRSPYDCFQNTVATADGQFMIKGMEAKLPMVYALRASKNAGA
ncbi:MAG: class I SAM-dependent methyltransferase [Flavobacteriales bacterium]|nr:class I SAM-dependent methyltransferase [Flavobacteriales bacterium]